MIEEQVKSPITAERPDILERVLVVLAILALALAPTQLTIPKIPLHPSEAVLLLGVVVWAFRWLWRDRTCRALPPLSHWLMVLAAGAGVFFLFGDHLLPADNDEKELFLSLVKEVVQVALYLLLAYPVFRTALTTPRRMRAAVIALLATTTLAVALAVAQRVALQADYQPDPAKRTAYREYDINAYRSAQLPFHVCGPFASWSEHGYNPSRATYAGFLALVLPFALVLLVSERKRPGMVIWISVLLLGAAATVMAGYLAPAILLGLLVTGFALGWRAGRQTLIGVVLYLLVVSVVGGLNRQEIMQAPFQLRITAKEATYGNGDGTRHLKKFWGEQQAALNVVRANPLFGAGAGSYQDQVGQAYGSLGKVDEQRNEPNALNGYLLTAATMGVLGLAVLLLLYGGYLGMARRAVAAGGSPWTAALLGAMVALALITLATNPWVRGLSVVIVAWLAAIGNFTTFSPDGRKITSDDVQLSGE
ncbi:MAG: hypothetical protein ACYC6A_26405 [Armatimonadota bacterium]